MLGSRGRSVLRQQLSNMADRLLIFEININLILKPIMRLWHHASGTRAASDIAGSVMGLIVS